jgi:hypothetical protein
MNILFELPPYHELTPRSGVSAERRHSTETKSAALCRDAATRKAELRAAHSASQRVLKPSWAVVSFALQLVRVSCGLALAWPAALTTGLAASETYRTAAVALNSGGGPMTSPLYSLQCAVGEIGQVTTAPAPAVVAKNGRIGQLLELTSLTLLADPAVIPETSHSQLSGQAMLDDRSQLSLRGADLFWRPESGLAVSIDPQGLLTAGNVYQPSSGWIEGRFPGGWARINLTIVNTGDDDYDLYAHDQIPDPWQIGYFGERNPAGQANADPDSDGQSNLAEFMAGVLPTNHASRFVLELADLPDLPTQKFVIFSPRLADRSYTVEYSVDLGAGFQPLADGGQIDFGETRFVLDPEATEPSKFYRVKIRMR